MSPHPDSQLSLAEATPRMYREIHAVRDMAKHLLCLLDWCLSAPSLPSSPPPIVAMPVGACDPN